MFKRQPPQLTKDLIPIKIPYLIREGWGFIALCYISSPITIAFLLKLVDLLDKLLGICFGKSYKFSAFVCGWGGIIIIILFFVGPWWIVFSKTSSFIVKIIKHHLTNNDYEKAIKVALMLDYQVWYREYRKNEWFRTFIVENNLIEKSERYRHFFKRY